MNSKRKRVRRFNTTGICLPEEHYLSDREAIIKKIITFVEDGNYFTINRPRQYGKTTILSQVEKELEKKDYLVLTITFEGSGDLMFSDDAGFASEFIELLYPKLEQFNPELADSLLKKADQIVTLNKLSRWIKEMIVAVNKKVVLQIDEVDNASNNELFLRFLGMLRAKYLKRGTGLDATFSSVILAGLYDVKNLKLKIRPDSERQYNSPWNIAVDFNLDLNFSPAEIAELLNKYTADRGVTIDIPVFADQLFYLTSGYPFLVSYLCKIIDEEILPAKTENAWEPEDLENAVQMALQRDNTNFGSLIGKLEDNPDLYNLVYQIIMNGEEFFYNPHEQIMSVAFRYGVLRKEKDRVRVHNRLYEQMIYNYMTARLKNSNRGEVRFDAVSSSFILSDGSLDIKKVILKFQEFMKEQYSQKDTGFVERNGRLLFLAFLKPILNGRGYDFKEVQASEEKRLDIVVTFGSKKFIIELKKWYGQKAHENGLNQLADYLERQNRNNGYLIIYDSRKTSSRIGDSDTVTVNSRTIFMVWV